MNLIHRIVAALVVVLLLGACAPMADSESDVGQADEPLTLREMTESQARALFDRELKLGIDPCEPPPDPWHPFVIYGFCLCSSTH